MPSHKSAGYAEWDPEFGAARRRTRYRMAARLVMVKNPLTGSGTAAITLLTAVNEPIEEVNGEAWLKATEPVAVFNVNAVVKSMGVVEKPTVKPGSKGLVPFVNPL